MDRSNTNDSFRTRRSFSSNKVAPRSKGSGVTIKAGSHSMRGGRDHQEDRCISVVDFNELLPTGVKYNVPRSFFAVFDGHGGYKCSEYLVRHFHINLAQHPNLVDDPEGALKDVWKSTDDDFLQYCRDREQAEGRSVWRDGSTASVILMVGKEAYVANTGRPFFHVSGSCLVVALTPLKLFFFR